MRGAGMGAGRALSLLPCMAAYQPPSHCLTVSLHLTRSLSYFLTHSLSQSLTFSHTLTLPLSHALNHTDTLTVNQAAAAAADAGRGKGRGPCLVFAAVREGQSRVQVPFFSFLITLEPRIE
jgi:hypothetical protein